MTVIQAGAWGVAGGSAAGLIALSLAVVRADFMWPWRYRANGIWPHLFVMGAGVIVGALAAAAAHGQMTGAWPAFLLGAGAPSVIRGAIGRVEVTERPLGGQKAVAERPARRAEDERHGR